MLHTAFAQHQFYIGIRQGVGYANNMVKSQGPTFAEDHYWNGTKYTLTEEQSLITILHGPGSSTRFELLYGFKRIRIGYQLDYLYSRAFSYSTKITPPERGTSGASSGKFINKYGSHFIGHTLLLEVLVYEKGKFSISPNVSIGYFSEVVRSNMVSSHMRYFQTGAGLMLGYKMGPVFLYLNPDYMIRYGKYGPPIIVFGGEPRNIYHMVHSAMLNVGARVELLSLKKSKDKK